MRNENIVNDAIETARKEFLTNAKKKENAKLINDMIEYMNDAICERIIHGFVHLRLEVSECKIIQYKIIESKRFSVGDGCYEEGHDEE
jgi:hypothetical protein